MDPCSFLVTSSFKPSQVLSNTNSDLIFHNLQNQLKQLLNALETVCAFLNLKDVRILLYFDEAHELGHTIPDDKQKNMYDIICSSLNHCQTSAIFTLFLSTQSSLGHFSPSAEMASSARQLSMKYLQAPFMEMPFDCHPTFPLKPGAFNLEQLQDLAFLACFGRPLFWSLIEASTRTDRSELAEKMMALACAKLVHSSDFGKDGQSDLAMLATLDVLITINYESRWDLVHKYEMDMVDSHMRIAFSVLQHRFYICSGYPSEPFLAEAASCCCAPFSNLSFSCHLLYNFLSRARCLLSFPISAS
ncbi:hypothetical protein F5141DRAFT_1010789 [Pisolithus sp. B1]|nr:hypothetical protein F5141DRAFT_1010789 [Pisolithus sp. B1]